MLLSCSCHYPVHVIILCMSLSCSCRYPVLTVIMTRSFLLSCYFLFWWMYLSSQNSKKEFLFPVTPAHRSKVSRWLKVSRRSFPCTGYSHLWKKVWKKLLLLYSRHDHEIPYWVKVQNLIRKYYLIEWNHGKRKNLNLSKKVFKRATGYSFSKLFINFWFFKIQNGCQSVWCVLWNPLHVMHV